MADENGKQENEQNDAGGRPSGITFADLFAIIRKHIVTAVICFVAVVAVAGGYAFLASPQYSATAQIIATYNSSQDSDNAGDITQQNTGGTYVSNQIKSYPTLATTETVLKPVIAKLKLDTSVRELSNQLTVTNPSNTAFVNITATAGVASQSAAVANAVADSLSNIVEHDLYAKGVASPITLTVVQRAVVPQEPSAPNKKLCIVAGIAFGLVAGIVAALLKDLLNKRVEETSDVRGIVHASALGSIPANESLEGTRPVIIAEPNGPITEEYRRIRTNIKFLQVNQEEGKGQLLVISSASASEGKTTTAVNTAAVLAENGARVLLIDADLRHPSVAHYLGIEGNVGLAHVLSGQMAPMDVVQNYWKPNLHILPAGKRPANASLLLNSDMMKMLVDQALLQYDYVIIDTAPLTVSNDAVVFGSWTSGVILVTARGICKKKSLDEIAESLRTAKVPVLGFVFNFANPKKEHKGAYYYYYDDSPRSGSRRGRKH